MSRTWRGLGGQRPTGVDGVEFDKQLDKLSLWVEDWGHDVRCRILEGIMSRSRHSQVQFLWTVTQPALHRDFMYTARKEFPALQFQPVSTHQSRRFKEKFQRIHRKDDYHRVQSAYMRHLSEARNASKEAHQTHFNNRELLSFNRDHEAGENRRSGHASPKCFSSLPQITHAEYTKKQNELHQAVGLSTGEAYTSGWEVIKSAPPTLSVESPQIFARGTQSYQEKFIEMPMRRHMQDGETSPLQANSTSQLLGSQSKLSKKGRIRNSTNTNKRKGKLKHLQPAIETVPLEAWRVYHWYEDQWSDVQRNEFLHKLLLKLDHRQHYFISSYLAVKQYRDFISLLSEDLALKIFSYLPPAELMKASLVSSTWHRLANHNSLWKSKCSEVKLEIPIPRDPIWKKVFKDNIKVKENWQNGRCRIMECKGHTKNVLSLAFDRRRMASGSSDTTIKIWDLKTGNLLQTLRGHTKGVWCLSFFTRNLLISGSYDSTIRIWNIKTGSSARTIIGHDGPVWCLCRRGNTVVSGSQDKTAKVWDISRCLLYNTLALHQAAIFSVDMDEEGKVAVTGSADRSIRIWDIWTGTCMKVIWVSQTTSIMAVCYSQGYIACSYGELICLFKADTGKRIRTLDEHQKRVECLQLKIIDKEQGQGVIISAGQDGMIKYWDLSQKKSVQTFQGHGDRTITCLKFDELRIASASHDNKIRIWDFNV